jgi:hypothetical protein
VNKQELAPQWFGALMKTWDRLEPTLEGRREFGACLARLGFSRAESGCFKDAYTSSDGLLVMKWDMCPDPDKTEEHAWTEFVTWRNSAPRKRAHLAPVIRYHNGLILQKRVKACNDRCGKKLEAMSLASKLKISHWYHHGHLGSGIMFFDYDDIGLIADDVTELSALVAATRPQGNNGLTC